MAAIRFDVVTVFPGIFAPVFEAGVVGRAIARGLVEAQGGEIWAERRETGGARVSFTIPASV